MKEINDVYRRLDSKPPLEVFEFNRVFMYPSLNGLLELIDELENILYEEY